MMGRRGEWTIRSTAEKSYFFAIIVFNWVTGCVAIDASRLGEDSVASPSPSHPVENRMDGHITYINNTHTASFVGLVPHTNHTPSTQPSPKSQNLDSQKGRRRRGSQQTTWPRRKEFAQYAVYDGVGSLRGLLP